MPGELTYFGVNGRACPIRMMLAHKKVKYTDTRVTFEEHGVAKAAGKWGALPIWTENGVTMDETKPLIRYLGTIHGYYPKDPVDQWSSDVLTDYSYEIL